MNIPKILASAIFILLGVLVFYYGILRIRQKGIRNSYIDLFIGIAFVIIGLLVGLGYIN